MTAPTLKLYDFMRPGLEAGTYTIEARHAVDLSGTGVTDAPPIDPATRKFTVQGPRFTLDPTEIHAFYPPANAVGPFAHTFPHVVLATRTLPWERELNLAGGKLSAPWLALVVLEPTELPAPTTSAPDGVATTGPTGAVPMDVRTLLAGGDGVIQPAPVEPVSDTEKDHLRCQVLKIPFARFAAVGPKASELPYLAHVRRIDAGGDDVEAEDVGWFALVAANRAPAPGSRGVVHLVSLEGHESLLEGKASGNEVWLVSLASWSFTATPDPGRGFGELAAGLAAPRPDGRQDLALGLRYDDGDAVQKLAPTDPQRRVADRLADGYVPVTYHLPTGEDTFAWYRGPFVARQSTPVDAAARPFPSSSAALVYEPDTGLFDVSLAVAWEIGRAVALADRKFAMELVRFRRAAHRLVDLVLAGLESTHIDTSDDNLAKIAQSGLVEHRFLDVLRDDLAAKVAKLSSGETTHASPPRAAPPPPAPTDPVAAVQDLLARDDLEALVAAAVADDLQPVAEWLAGLTLLHLVPFAYLVPHPGLLPDESARFFDVDPNWTGALFDGALSIGVQSSRDTWLQQLTQNIVPDAWKEAGHTTAAAGMLVRSALVSGWPGLTVEADADGSPLEVVRPERLAPNVLLCLFSGVPDQVRVRAPHQGLHFAVENHHVTWRSEADGVLDVAATAGADGPAGLARKMLDFPDQLTFKPRET